MRFLDGKGSIPEGAGEADKDDWQLCPHNTHRRSRGKDGVEICVPFKKTAHGAVSTKRLASVPNTAPLLQIISPHKSIAVSWDDKWVCNPCVTRAKLNAALKSGKPALVKEEGPPPRSLHLRPRHGRRAEAGEIVVGQVVYE
jgi:hypothetical protein